MTKTVLVAVDQSEGSRRAAAFVDRFFGGTDVSITAVNVSADPALLPPVVPVGVPFGGVYAWGLWPGPAGQVGMVGSEDERGRALAEAEAVAAREAPSAAEAEARLGDPVDAIVEAAEEIDADLIVVGTNDRGLLDRLIGGSVSRELVKSAPRPVLVVR